MRIANYNKGYQEWCDCVIHGTIYFTKEEWEKVNRRKQYTEGNPYLSSVMTKKAIYLALGVTMTEKMVKKNKIEGYKDNNYQIIITL